MTVLPSESIQVETYWPILSVFAGASALVLCIVQYFYGPDYFQSKVYESGGSLGNVWLFYFQLIGVDGMIMNGILTQYFLLCVTYLSMAVVERSIGFQKLAYFLFVCTMFSICIADVASTICEGDLQGFGLANSPYCCGSFLTYSSIAFAICVQRQRSVIEIRWAYSLLMAVVLAGCIVYDFDVTFASSPTRQCSALLWHAPNFLLGVFSFSGIGTA